MQFFSFPPLNFFIFSPSAFTPNRHSFFWIIYTPDLVWKVFLLLVAGQVWSLAINYPIFFRNAIIITYCRLSVFLSVLSLYLFFNFLIHFLFFLTVFRLLFFLYIGSLFLFLKKSCFFLFLGHKVIRWYVQGCPYSLPQEDYGFPSRLR